MTASFGCCPIVSRYCQLIAVPAEAQRGREQSTRRVEGRWKEPSLIYPNDSNLLRHSLASGAWDYTASLRSGTQNFISILNSLLNEQIFFVKLDYMYSMDSQVRLTS